MRLQITWSVVVISRMVTAASTEAADSLNEFDWSSITPSAELQFHDCNEGFKCARLVLPMDWLDGANRENVTIAITKLPAIVNDDDVSFGGAIFSQPGGPGVSGTVYGRGKGRRHQKLFDKPGKKHYEIISFDPRGMGQSTPKINCFPGLLGYVRDLERLATGGYSPTPETLAMAVAAAKADGIQCDKVHGKYLSYVGTPNVVRDMLAILDKVEEQRHVQRHQQDDDRIELRSEKQHELPRLQFVGISYGTAIGQFFASMFPGRVGRIVLDGVVDVEEAANGLVRHGRQLHPVAVDYQFRDIHRLTL